MDKVSAASSAPVSGDNNQPMDLAQKPHNLKIPDTGGGSKSLSATVVHFGGQISSKLPPGNSMHGSQAKIGIRMDSPGFSLIARQPASSGNAALNLTSSSGTLKNLSHPSSLTITPPTVSGPPPTAHSGCHIPRGPAYVANIAAPRSQNIASIVRTTPQNASTLMASTSIRSNSGQRVIPISTTGNTWNRVTPSTVMAKVPTPPSKPAVGPRSVPSHIGNATTLSPVVNPKTQSFQKTSAQGPMRSTASESIKMQVPKQNSSYPITTPKYITSNNRISSQAPGSANGASCDNIYTPSSSLVTSLASSGTTITPHAVSRAAPSAISVRITSAATGQVTGDTGNSVGLASMGISGNPSCTMVPIHPVQTRIAGSEHHIPLKTPIVRSSSMNNPHVSKGPAAMPGTQISYGATKIISQGMAQGFSVSQLSMPKSCISTSIPSTMPFHSRSSASLTSINRTNSPNHAVTRVLSTPSLTHPQSALASLKTSSLPISIPEQDRHRAPPGKSGCSITILGGTRSDAEYNSPIGGSNQKSERTMATTPHYNINPPYILESPSSTISQNTVSITHPTIGHRASPSNHMSNVRPASVPCSQNSSESSQISSGLPVTSLKTNASPRPSILRKRPDMEIVPSKVAKNLTASLIGPIGSPPSPKRPDSRGNLCDDDSRILSGKDTSSSEDSQASSAVTLSQQLASSVGGENGLTVKNHIQLNIPQLADGVSPRKKPRKQQLMGNELQESKSSDEGFILRPTKRFKLELPSYENDASNDFEVDQSFPANSARRSPEQSPEPQTSKRNHMSLIRSYKVWKSRHNHFKSHKEIKLKDEKKKTVNDIANQKLVLERAKGWKVVHLMGQVDDLVDAEGEVMEKLNAMLTSWEIANRKIQKDPSKELKMLSELFKANIQRSKTIRAQMVEAKVQMNRIFDHKPTVLDVLSKYSNKRNIRRREKT